MGDQVVREKQIQVPVRFEIRRVAHARLVDLVLVRVDELNIRVLSDRPRDPEQRVFGQCVVLVEEGDVLTVREFDCGVAGGRNVSVALSEHHFDASVLLCISAQHSTHGFVRRRVVSDAQLPVRVELALDRQNRRLEHRRGWVVDRHDN